MQITFDKGINPGTMTNTVGLMQPLHRHKNTHQALNIRVRIKCHAGLLRVLTNQHIHFINRNLVITILILKGRLPVFTGCLETLGEFTFPGINQLTQFRIGGCISEAGNISRETAHHALDTPGKILIVFVCGNRRQVPENFQLMGKLKQLPGAV